MEETSQTRNRQDPALVLVEPCGVYTGPLLELVQVPLDGIPSLRRVDRTTQLDVICKLDSYSKGGRKGMPRNSLHFG